MPRTAAKLVGALALLTVGCSNAPPIHWQQGGATLALGSARWQRGNRVAAEIFPDGTVEERGHPTMWIDTAGRIADVDRAPVAVLLPDGLLAGTNDTNLGRVGQSNASPPGATYAWLAVMPDGTVMRFDSGGDRRPDGAWTGCEGPLLRTCTLVTHVIAMRNYRDRRSGPTVGIGVGFGL